MMKLTAYEIKKIVESKFPDAKVTGIEPFFYTTGPGQDYTAFNSAMTSEGNIIGVFFGDVTCLFCEFASSPGTTYLELYRAADLSISAEAQVAVPIANGLAQNTSIEYNLPHQMVTRIALSAGYHYHTFCGYKISVEPVE